MKERFDPGKLTADFVAFRRATFFGAILASTGLAAWLLWRTFLPEGISVLEGVQLVLFVLLFQQIATGFWLVVFGFLLALTGGERAQISRTIPDDAVTLTDPPPTAVVLPIYNEDVARVFRGLEAMWRGLQECGNSRGFDFFILSDSNRPDNWLAEENAWFSLCRRLNAFGRIFYRKRRVSRNSKSGNVADFCRRWGAKYRYMIVLDADSIVTGRLLSRLVAMMEQNPGVGLIQTAPQMALGRTFFRRIQQFAARLYAPLFAAGSNYWHLFGANYWGHNAIIRLRPFIESCDLPELPEPEWHRRHIFSHDTIEAALMRKAGYQVWFAYTEEGSYEEGPPNLNDSLARDRRWSLGNLQHFWFLFAPGIDFANRFHIWMGVMAYLSSPLWLLFLITGTLDLAIKHRFSLLAALPGVNAFPAGGAVPLLLVATLVVLFVPKFLAMLLALPTARRFGGAARLVISTLIETLIWTLLAPAIMIYYTQFVIMNLAGIPIRWGAQNRSDDRGPGLGETIRRFWIPPVFGVLATAAILTWVPQILPWISPILLGWLLAPILAWLTAQPWLGDWTRKLGLFLIPEENPVSRPAELSFVENAAADPSSDHASALRGIIRAVADPVTLTLHGSLLRKRPPAPAAKAAYLESLRHRLLTEGPGALSQRETFALLWDAESLRLLHRAFWENPADTLHPDWREALRHAVKAGAP